MTREMNRKPRLVRLVRLTGLALIATPWISFGSNRALAEAEPKDANAMTWAIALHGGAHSGSNLTPAQQEAYRKSLRAALQVGVEILEKGGTALDATEAVVVALENDPMFNAGKGEVFTTAGMHELDASIMDGRSLAGGGVAGVRTLRNPIKAARLVMQNTPHVILGGAEAEAFALRHGCETVTQDYFYVPRRFEQLQVFLKDHQLPMLDSPGYPLPAQSGSLPRRDDRRQTAAAELAVEAGGTVGCVALDSHGNLAAATSTGGLTGKMPGRIGDSPILGAGTFADNKSCAVSGTGKGEEFIRHSIAARVGWLVESGLTLDEAVHACLTKALKPGDGGLIAVDREGHLVLETTTGGMPRAAADSTGRREVAISFDR